MNANRHELLLHKEVYAVVGGAIETFVDTGCTLKRWRSLIRD